MSEVKTMTINDIIAQMKINNKKADTDLIKRHMLMQKIIMEINLENLESHI